MGRQKKWILQQINEIMARKKAQKCIQHAMKENILLLKDLSKFY